MAKYKKKYLEFSDKKSKLLMEFDFDNGVVPYNKNLLQALIKLYIDYIKNNKIISITDFDFDDFYGYICFKRGYYE